MPHPSHRLVSHSRYQESRAGAADGRETPRPHPASVQTPIALVPPSVSAVQSSQPPEPIPPPRSRTSGPSGARSRRQWSPERSRALRRYRFAVMALGTALAWFVAIAFSLWHQGEHLDRQLAVARDDVRTALQILGELGIERPVGALIYAAGKPVYIDAPPLQEIMFVTLAAGGSIEARLTLFNGGPAELRPGVEVILLDRLGLELGQGRLQGDVSGPPLRPGETRTYHLPIQLARAAEPAWFKAQLLAD